MSLLITLILLVIRCPTFKVICHEQAKPYIIIHKLRLAHEDLFLLPLSIFQE